MNRRYCAQLRLLLVIVLLAQLGWSKTCSENLDCGSNIRYKYCDTKNSPETCVHCSESSQCNVNNGDICHHNGYCEIEPMFKHIGLFEIMTFIAIFVGAMVAAGGGLGGGGVFVPIFILILGMDAKTAAALSQATIFGGSIVNLTMNFRQQHPSRVHRTLADLPTVLIFAPLLLGGAVMGVILNQIMPDPIIVILMIVVLGYAAYRTVGKGIRLWQKENELKAKQQQNALNYRQRQNDARASTRNNQASSFMGASNRAPNNSLDHRSGQPPSHYTRLNQNDKNGIEYPNVHTNNSTNIKEEVYGIECANEDDGESSIVRSERQSQASSQVPWLVKVARESGVDSTYLQSKLNQRELQRLERLMTQESEIIKPMVAIFVVWCIVSVFSILRSTDLIVDLSCGSVEYWGVVFGIYPCLMIITALVSWREVRAYKQKLSLYWMPCEGDIEWTPKRAVLYPLIAMVAGILGGLLGIGGGMIVSPLLFELGVLPRVAAATSAIAVMITSSSSLLQKYLANMISVEYLIFYAVLGMMGTLVGQTGVNWLVRKSGRTSIVVFAVSTIIWSAVFLMGIDGFLDLDWHIEFVSLC